EEGLLLRGDAQALLFAPPAGVQLFEKLVVPAAVDVLVVDLFVDLDAVALAKILPRLEVGGIAVLQDAVHVEDHGRHQRHLRLRIPPHYNPNVRPPPPSPGRAGSPGSAP